MKHFKIETQGLRKPQVMSNADEAEQFAAALEDEQTLDFYNLFSEPALAPESKHQISEQSRVVAPFLYLEVSTVPLSLTINLAHSLQSYKKV